MTCAISWSLLATIYWSRDENGIEWPYDYYAAERGRLHLLRATAVEGEFDIVI